jgi:hypothetical protein
MSISTRVVATLARRGMHYGWVVVATTFLVVLVTAGAVGAPGVLMLPLQREFGWSTAAISSALAMRLLLFGLTRCAKEQSTQPAPNLRCAAACDTANFRAAKGRHSPWES